MLLETFKKGHEIANHSWSHPQLTLMSPEQQAKEIYDTDDLILSYWTRYKVYDRLMELIMKQLKN